MANINSDKVLNCPPLRFPEFMDDWKRMKASDLLEFYSTNSLAWEALNYESGAILNLHYGLIHKGMSTLIDTTREKLPYINGENTLRKYTLCKCGDVAFADASEDTEEVGKAVEFILLGDDKVVCGLHTIHGRDKTGCTVTGFKGYAFNSKPFHNQMRRIAQGTKIYSINTKNFEEVYVGIPSKEEQAKIAKLLASIDERISTQIGLIEDLKKLKSAISHKLFSDKRLDLRKQIGEFAKLRNGYAFQSSTYRPNAEYNIVTIANVTGKRHIDSIGCNTVPQIPLDIQEHQILSKEDILISLTGNVGRVSMCKQGKYLLNQRVGLLQITAEIEKEYLYQILSTKHFELSMVSCGQGAAQMNIGNKDVENYSFPYTKDKTLIRKIAACLRTIDEKIEIEEQTLKTLSSQKQYLLRMMFV